MGFVHGLLIAIAILGYPILATWVVGRFRWIAWLSPVVQCFLFGVLLANIPGLVHDDVAVTLMTASVPLGIPLLLFTADFPAWTRLARPTVISFVLALIAVLIVAAVAAHTLSVPGEESWKVAGMAVGTYTGGTANMAAIKWALEVHDETFGLVNAVDLLWGGLFLIFLFTVAQKVLGFFLPKFKTAGDGGGEAMEVAELKALRQWPVLRQGMIGLALSVLVAVLSAIIAAGVTFALNPEIAPGKIPDAPFFESVLMVALSTLAIAASFIPRIRGLRGAFPLGEYFILVFAVAVGTRADVMQLIAAGGPFLLYIGFVMFGAIALHWLLCALFRIDTDTAIITAVAAIYGPAFIGPVAGALKNKDIIVSGITSAVVGIAIGTQLGLALAHLMAP